MPTREHHATALARVNAASCAVHDSFDATCAACHEARAGAWYAEDCPPDETFDRCTFGRFILDDAHFVGDAMFGCEYAECTVCGEATPAQPIVTVLRVKSHRARHALVQLVGAENVAEFFSWHDDHVFAVPSDRVAEALTIKGVGRARPNGHFQRCVTM